MYFYFFEIQIEIFPKDCSFQKIPQFGGPQLFQESFLLPPVAKLACNSLMSSYHLFWLIICRIYLFLSLEKKIWQNIRSHTYAISCLFFFKWWNILKLISSNFKPSIWYNMQLFYWCFKFQKIDQKSRLEKVYQKYRVMIVILIAKVDGLTFGQFKFQNRRKCAVSFLENVLFL